MDIIAANTCVFNFSLKIGTFANYIAVYYKYINILSYKIKH